MSALARSIDVPVSKLWWYMRGRVRWPADVWLQVLVALGVARPRKGWLRIALPLPPGDDLGLGLGPEPRRAIFDSRGGSVRRAHEGTAEAVADSIKAGPEGLTYEPVADAMGQPEEFEGRPPPSS